MNKFACKISEQIAELEIENERNARDSRFYFRLLVQIAMQQGGSIYIDPKFGQSAIEYKGRVEIDSKGFHIEGIK